LIGQMVLPLTIEPGGSVSMCVLYSSDMDYLGPSCRRIAW
jgi:hypothetical protein